MALFTRMLILMPRHPTSNSTTLTNSTRFKINKALKDGLNTFAFTSFIYLIIHRFNLMEWTPLSQLPHPMDHASSCSFVTESALPRVGAKSFESFSPYRADQLRLYPKVVGIGGGQSLKVTSWWCLICRISAGTFSEVGLLLLLLLPEWSWWGESGRSSRSVWRRGLAVTTVDWGTTVERNRSVWSLGGEEFLDVCGSA